MEILKGDSFKLGVKAKFVCLGNLPERWHYVSGAAGSAEIKEGIIVAQRPIHMLPADATHGVCMMAPCLGEFGGLRGGTLMLLFVQGPFWNVILIPKKRML